MKNFDEISEKLVLQNPNISDFNKRAIISIKADKNNVDMDAIDKIETVLREVNALRINYSILNTKK